MQVLDHRVHVESLEFLGIVEILAHRIGQIGVPMENLNVQLVRPPVAVGTSPGACERALARVFLVGLCIHGFLRSRSVGVRSHVRTASLSESGLSGLVGLHAAGDKISLSPVRHFAPLARHRHRPRRRRSRSEAARALNWITELEREIGAETVERRRRRSRAHHDRNRSGAARLCKLSFRSTRPAASVRRFSSAARRWGRSGCSS